MTRNRANVTQRPHAMRSAPFDPSERRRIAVKIVTATEMEITPVRQIEAPS